MCCVPRYWYYVQWNGAHQPIVGVTWFEALAYARVANGCPPKRNGKSRGGNGRQYPWGDTFDLTRECGENRRERHVRRGRFSPGGDSPYGVTHMAGNIWEWTSTLYQPYPYRPGDGRESLQEDAGRRVLRGGSWQSRFIEHTRA